MPVGRAASRVVGVDEPSSRSLPVFHLELEHAWLFRLCSQRGVQRPTSSQPAGGQVTGWFGRGIIPTMGFFG